ncbi:polysaccharide deacetylase family protein [Stieleria sp. TO1_6]|uniref:polysaccharide deacetylase family protein n=1 Tax=Stieleria tagensis TaxID=2956795 RepID=UPI00209B09D5|nr:polysaccharide deacetylase family protein [Stieleria tagensis]MCO8122509.1 polysaccharide deacetylase family protein [Stieleria tagensis]
MNVAGEIYRGLVVTIDTEEEGLWSGEYAAKATVQNINSVPRFQMICDRHGIRPTYLVTTPVAESADAVRILKTIQDEDRCEIATHVHPWNSPPVDDHSTPRNSYLCNLPTEVQREKLLGLTELIECQFERRPIAFRAGRYGADATTLRILKELGYQVDSSVLPRADYRSQGGPDFRAATCIPYFPSEHDILGTGEDDGLLEVPVTAGYTHSHFELADRLRAVAMRRPWKSFKAVGLLDRTGIATKVKLSPEQASLQAMQQLAAAMIRRGSPVLVLMFHSSSLLPGCSPYVRSEADLDDFLDRLDRFFQFAVDQLGLDTLTLGECFDHRGHLCPGQLPGSKL